MVKKGLGNSHSNGSCLLRCGLGCKHSRLPHPDPVAMPKRKRWLLFQAHNTCPGWTTKENDANWDAAVMKSGEVWNAIAHDVQQEEIPLWLPQFPAEEALPGLRSFWQQKGPGGGYPWKECSQEKEKKIKKHKEHPDKTKDSEYTVVCD